MFGDSQTVHSTVVVTHSTERCNRSLCVSTDEIRVYCFTGVCSGALLQAWYNEYLRWSVAGVVRRVPALVCCRRGTTSTCAGLLQAWHNEYLRWSPDDYGGIERILLPSDSVWTPDIVLYNRFDTLKYNAPPRKPQ